MTLPLRGLCLSGVFGSILSGAAAAAPSAELIEWSGPAGCAELNAVSERVEAILGYELTSLGPVERIIGNVTQPESKHRLTLDVFERGRKSSRVIEADSCADLVDAAALAVTLALTGNESDSASAGSVRVDALGSEAPLEPPKGNAAALRGMEPADTGAPTASDDAAPTGVRWSGAAAAALDMGAFDEPAPGMAVEARAGLGAMSLGLYGVWLPAQRMPVRPQEFVEFELITAGLRGCHAWPLLSPVLKLGACIGFEAGRFTARGIGLGAARVVHDPWFAPGAALEAQLSLSGPLQLQLRAEPLLTLSRKQYAINGMEGVHSPAMLGARLYLGLALSTD
jgi:hypothetical protein